jgi:cell division protein FtsN
VAENRKSALQLTLGLVGLSLLSGCAGSHRVAVNAPSTGYFVAHAAGDYRPPGPASDPWGPYISLAASRFDVPQQWIRQVMQVESGGNEYINGQLTVSPAGAMGLMQLEPETYQEMANRYGLGSDPFNPYDNIMAGTAYIHEMYQVYGSPGFLAAYNAGPGRLDNYMDYHQPLPHETVNYVAMIAPQIQGYYPQNRSEADQLALNTLPASEAPGLLPPGFSPEALPVPPAQGPAPAPDSPSNPLAPVAVAALEPPASSELSQDAMQQVATQPTPTPLPPPPVHPGFSFIPSAMADTPARTFEASSSTNKDWAIQVGAYGTASKARAALGIAELSAVQVLMQGQPVVVAVHESEGTIYRARVVQLPHEQAIDACHRLLDGPTGCVILSPDAQS